MESKNQTKLNRAQIPSSILDELKEYEEWIAQYRRREIGEVKMQKIRLQLGTYAQRQDGVQMQRIKFPGGVMSAAQLRALAGIADKYANGFIHITTREDAQLYYIQLEKCPDMMRDLAAAGITTREACGNTVRNITACSRSGMSATEAFEVGPYCQALFRFLVRNKWNQVMGRKFKIAFEGCTEDHAGMRFHDIGFQAVVRNQDGKPRRGFRIYLGGGLGAVPVLGWLYSDFVPEEEIFNLTAAALRIFDRCGERKNRMAARMKFLVKKLGWEKFKALVDEERKEVILAPAANEWISKARVKPEPPRLPAHLPSAPEGIEQMPAYQTWVRDSTVAHRFPGFKGVQVRLRLGDILTDPARALADLAETFSHGELRTTLFQNLFFPDVPEKALPALYSGLSKIKLADSGAETLEDVTTCPGADTCRLGITSAKGLGATISEAMNNGLGRYKELSRDIRIKVSGCPNGCAQHGIAQIGFQGAALQKDGKTVPCHELFLGGESSFDQTAFGERMGKYPARNCPKIVETLVGLYAKEKQGNEAFNACMKRVGKERILALLAPFAEIPSFETRPEFYEDWGHGNEKFTVRTGIKGECAGAPVQEKSPHFEEAKEKLAQAEAFLMHKEFLNAQLEAYEAVSRAVRVPLYAALVDPFTPEQAVWEFENVFVRSGKADRKWWNIAEKLESEKKQEPAESRARQMIDLARQLLAESERLYTELLQGK